MKLRTVLVALVTALGVIVCTTARAYANDSGTLGNWQTYSKSISARSILDMVGRHDGIYMAGDSISVTTAKELGYMLYPSHNLLAVNNWSGRPTAPSVTAIKGMLDGSPSRRILMATGSNDIFNPGVMSGQIDALMRIAGNRKVFWVTVYVSRWKYPAAIQAADKRNTVLVNNQINAAAGRWPNLVVIPWDKWLAAKPFRYALYLRDGVHTSALGATFRNTIIRDAILAQRR